MVQNKRETQAGKRKHHEVGNQMDATGRKFERENATSCSDFGLSPIPSPIAVLNFASRVLSFRQQQGTRSTSFIQRPAKNVADSPDSLLLGSSEAAGVDGVAVNQHPSIVQQQWKSGKELGYSPNAKRNLTLMHQINQREKLGKSSAGWTRPSRRCL